MQPGDLYILGIVISALFVAPFSAIARVVVLSWIVGHLAFMAGLPEAWANLAGQLCVVTVGLRHLRDGMGGAAWALSIPLIALNTLWLSGGMQPNDAWWSVLVCAMIQLAVLPFTIEKDTMRAVYRAWHESTGRGLLFEGETR